MCKCLCMVRTQGLSRTHLAFFKDCIQCKKDLEFFHNMSNFILKVFSCLLLFLWVG